MAHSFPRMPTWHHICGAYPAWRDPWDIWIKYGAVFTLTDIVEMNLIENFDVGNEQPT